MKKFNSFNKATKLNVAMVSANGTITAIKPLRENVNGKPYTQFNADIITPKGVMAIGGKYYEALVPHLGATPIVGAKFEFASELADITNGLMTRWEIKGNQIGDAKDFLKMLK